VYARSENLKSIQISNQTKNFILETGFPHVVSFFSGLDRNSNLIDIARQVKLRELDDAVFPPEVAFAQRICIDTGCGGEIKCVNPINLEISFFNSSIEQLSASLATHQQAFSSNISFIESLQKFKTQLAQIDQKALENPENIWVRVIEQLILDEEGY
jgi:SUKH-4 immunity protein